MTEQGVVHIELWQLGLALVFVLTAGFTSVINHLGLGRELLVGTLRCFSQLVLMGFILTFIFGLNEIWLVLLTFAVMVFFAAHIIRGRVRERSVPFFLPTLGSMLLSYTLVTLLVCAVVVGVEPWWDARYFLPLGGMIIGNSMNAIALALDRLFSELRERRNEVEMMLCLGADYREASRDVLRNAMRAGMIPSINAMMGVGLVFIPGMMTGQILGGVDPLVAIRYQIVVMLMLVASTAISAYLAVFLARRRCFNEAHGLIIPRSES
jgi:putative ABC transport system permease protein